MTDSNEPMQLPDTDRLRQLLRYEAETGKLYWDNNERWRRNGKAAGYYHHRGYRYIRIDNATYAVHRVVWKMYYGFDPNVAIDHINLIKDDNRIANLREASKQENSRNTAPGPSNRSGFKGVCFHKISSKWRAQITANGKVIHLGYFDTPEQAHAAYAEAACKYFGEFARTA